MRHLSKKSNLKKYWLFFIIVCFLFFGGIKTILAQVTFSNPSGTSQTNPFGVSNITPGVTTITGNGSALTQPATNLDLGNGVSAQAPTQTQTITTNPGGTLLPDTQTVNAAKTSVLLPDGTEILTTPTTLTTPGGAAVSGGILDKSNINPDQGNNVSGSNNSNSNKSSGSNFYIPLQNVPLPGGGSLFGTNTIEGYLQNIFSFGIAITGGLAVIRIVQAGIMYMLDDMVTKKQEAKDIIWASVTGLLLALCSYVILYTINPELVKLKFNLTPTVAPTSSSGSISSTGTEGGSSGGVNAGVGGTIANNTMNGISFPTSSGLTDDEVKQMIINSGILNGPVPTDSSKYFPDGVPTVDGYKNLFAAIANSESGFNPNDNINHAQGTDVGNTYSEGLFSLTPTDSAVKALNGGAVPPDSTLADPKFNTQAAINIMKNQIEKTGSIAGTAGKAYWGPLNRGQ